MCNGSPDSCACCGPVLELPSSDEPAPATPDSSAAKSWDQPEFPEIIKSAMFEIGGKEIGGMTLPSLIGSTAIDVEEWSGFMRPHLFGRSPEKGERQHDEPVTVDKGQTIIRNWSTSISYELLEFSKQDTKVRRPKFVSAHPAALVLADKKLPTSLCLRVLAFPPNRTMLTVGVAKWPGFKTYFGKGFGEEEGSWGLQWRAEEDEPASDRLRPVEGDLICITCDALNGLSTVFLNWNEVGSYSLPKGGRFALGATLSTECVLAIET